MPFERRLHVLIDDERHRRLLAAARERGVSVATVVREAIDRALSSPGGDRREEATLKAALREHRPDPGWAAGLRATASAHRQTPGATDP